MPVPDAMCDGGDLDCGSGLLLIIRNAMKALAPGGILEVRSREISVKQDLPSWARMVGHSYIGEESGENKYTHYFVGKKVEDESLRGDMEQARNFAWRVRARWTEGMQAKVFARNHSFDVGQPASFETEDAAPGAVEYLLGAAAGDLAVGIQWRCSKESIQVFQIEVSLAAGSDNILVFLGVEDEGHPGLNVLQGKVYIDADAEPDRLKKIWAETIKRSPVAQSLLRQVEVDIAMRTM